MLIVFKALAAVALLLTNVLLLSKFFSIVFNAFFVNNGLINLGIAEAVYVGVFGYCLVIVLNSAINDGKNSSKKSEVSES